MLIPYHRDWTRCFQPGISDMQDRPTKKLKNKIKSRTIKTKKLFKNIELLCKNSPFCEFPSTIKNFLFCQKENIGQKYHS